MSENSNENANTDIKKGMGEELCILKKWNIIYMVKFYQNQKTLILGHIIQLFIAAITLAILYTYVNHNFKYAIYLLPLSLVYSSIQIILFKKRISNPRYHWIFQLCSFIIFLPLFLGIYYYIYNPTFRQSFQPGGTCQILKDSRAILQDGSYKENYQVLTVQFIHQGQLYQGCGCGSDKYQESIFQTKIEPFRYVTNDEMVSLNIKTKLEEEDISQIKMPSWMCQPYQDYTPNLKDGSKSANENKVGVEKCYFNFYGQKDSALSTQSQSDYCKNSNNFMQIIFDEKPYFPIGQFCLLIAFTLLPFFSFSLNWLLVILIHYLLPSLQIDIERTFFQHPSQLPFTSSNKIKPTPSSNYNSKEQSNINYTHSARGKSSENRQDNKPINTSKKQDNNPTNILSNNNKDNNNNTKNNDNENEDKNNINSINSFNKINNNDNYNIKVCLSTKNPLDQSYEKQNRKDSQNSSQLIENNKLLLPCSDGQRSISHTTIQYQNSSDCDIENAQKISESFAAKNEQNNLKRNQIFFSMPTMKKKFLPPIQGNINFQTILQENVKKEIEENKYSIENPVFTESPQLKKERKLYKYQSSIDLPDVISSNKQNIPSILHNKEKKGLNTSFNQKKKSKVQFIEINKDN